MPCQYSQRFFFAVEFTQPRAVLSMCGRGNIWCRDSRNSQWSSERARSPTTIDGVFLNIVVGLKTFFGFGLKNSHFVFIIYTYNIFTCILLICWHYKLSGRTNKYEKWTSCRAVSGSSRLTAGASHWEEETLGDSDDCWLPWTQSRLPMRHWIIMIDFYYMELQFILLNNKRPSEQASQGGGAPQAWRQQAWPKSVSKIWMKSYKEITLFIIRSVGDTKRHETTDIEHRRRRRRRHRERQRQGRL